MLTEQNEKDNEHWLNCLVGDPTIKVAYIEVNTNFPNLGPLYDLYFLEHTRRPTHKLPYKGVLSLFALDELDAWRRYEKWRLRKLKELSWKNYEL